MTTTIKIRAQYLDGNAPEGFRHDVWLRDLEDAYRAAALSVHADAEVDVEIDRQRRCSGATAPVTVDYEVDGEIDYDATLVAAVEAAPYTLEAAEEKYWA